MRYAPFKPVELDAKQRKQWQQTLGACSWIMPGLIHVVYTMLKNTNNKDDVALFTEEISTPAATDGFQLIFKPSLYFKYSLLNRVFAVGHEVCHEMWNHCRVAYAFKKAGRITVGGKSLPWNSEYANIMQDLIINDTLIASKYGEFNKDWLHNPMVANQHDDWVTAYFRNWKDHPKPPPPIKPPPGQGEPCDDGTPSDQPSKGRFDQHLEPHQSEGVRPEDAPERKQAQWDIAIKTAMEIQRAQGKLPAAMEMFFKRLLEPKVEWTDHIEGEFIRVLGQGAYDWRKLDRRLIVRGIGAPGVTGKGARRLIVGGDSSGSIFCDKALVARFLAEVGGMVEMVNPEQTHVVWCDSTIKRVDVCEDPADVRKMLYDGVPGGGGTDFREVFKYAEEMDVPPDMLVYLTDGDGEFPEKAPDFPVIWGDISGQPHKYKFGKVVHIPKDEADAEAA